MLLEFNQHGTGINQTIQKCNRIENPEISLYIYGQLNLNRYAENMQQKPDNVFNIGCIEYGNSALSPLRYWLRDFVQLP